MFKPAARRFRTILVLALALQACAGPATRMGTPPPVATEQANEVLFRALGLVGTPYRYGGNSPEGGFDCSGLVGFVYRDAAGLSLPRTSREIGAVDAPRVARSALASGDLVFFGNGRGINHVGIYVGENRFVHAPNSGGTVRLDKLDGAYWKEHFLFAKRVLR